MSKNENFDMLEAMRSELQSETLFREEDSTHNPSVSFLDVDSDYISQIPPETPYVRGEESVEGRLRPRPVANPTGRRLNHLFA